MQAKRITMQAKRITMQAKRITMQAKPSLTYSFDSFEEKAAVLAAVVENFQFSDDENCPAWKVFIIVSSIPVDISF